VRVICDCGAVREIEPEALARLVGWSTTLKALAPRLRCSHCGKKAAEVVAVARPLAARRWPVVEKSRPASRRPGGSSVVMLGTIRGRRNDALRLNRDRRCMRLYAEERERVFAPRHQSHNSGSAR
jgi:hypothetical protein